MIASIFQTIFSFFWFALVVFLFVLWFWLLISVISDLFRRDDVGGFGKVIWILFLVLLPFIGVFAYLLTQGSGMGARANAQALAARDQFRQTMGYSIADELEKLDRLKAAGTITADEHARLRAKAMG